MDDLLPLLACPACRGRVSRGGPGQLGCTSCGAPYPIEHGIPVLLPHSADPVRARYLRNYEQLAHDDLESPIVANRYELMHRELIRFIGDVRGMSVLDVGSAYGSYLASLNARLKVAVDIAMPYLESIPEDSGIVRVCGDAEALPVRVDAFDVIIISDVLEHLLDPDALVELLRRDVRPDARVIVHVPWEESLDQYRDVPYEFTHLRSFGEYGFRQLFRSFDVTRRAAGLPRVTEPVVFRLQGRLPRALYNSLVDVYFTSGLNAVEQRHRERWIRELPRRSRRLLRLYRPTYLLLELRPSPPSRFRTALRWAANQWQHSGLGRPS